MTNTKLPYGKTKATYDSRDLRYADYRTALAVENHLPTIPASFGHGGDFSNWLMLGNGPDDTVAPGFQGCGDCAWAAPAHSTMQIFHEAGKPIPVFSGKTVVDQYAEYSGYNIQTGANDNGSNMRDVLNWRQGKGYRDDTGTLHKIGPYVSLEPGNIEHVKEATYLFESLEIGIEVPSSAQNQFIEGKPWSVVPGSEIEGGHAIVLIGNPAPYIFEVITWGKRQLVTEEFLKKYMDESWAYISPERYASVTGKTYEGYENADMELFLRLVSENPTPT